MATLWTVAHQAPLSMGFSRQEHWSGLLFSPPGDLPDPGIKPASPVSSALAGGFFTTAPPSFWFYPVRFRNKLEVLICWARMVLSQTFFLFVVSNAM